MTVLLMSSIYNKSRTVGISFVLLPTVWWNNVRPASQLTAETRCDLSAMCLLAP